MIKRLFEYPNWALQLTKLFLIFVQMFWGMHSIVAAQESESILILQPKIKEFQEVIVGITDEVEGEFEINKKFISRKTDAERIRKLIQNYKPNVVILVGGMAVLAYKNYQQTYRGQEYPAAIAVATLYLDLQISNLHNVAGIIYEVPAVLYVVSLRPVLYQPPKKIGVVYREFLHSTIAKNQAFCAAENIELLGISLPNRPKHLSQQLPKALQELQQQNIDALWVVNDNILLSPNLIRKTWIPWLEKFKFPVMVGVSSLVATSLNFGTIAVFPDLYGLGSQVADLIYSLQQQSWQIEKSFVEQPIGIKKYFNMSISSRRGILYHPKQLQGFDQILQ